MSGEKCFMRWENRISCELPRGHVGVHTNLLTGLTWWGQVLFDPVPGSWVDQDRVHAQDDPFGWYALPEPQVRPIPPAWAEETNAFLWSALGDATNTGY